MKYLLCFMLLIILSISVTAQHGVRIEKELIEISFNSTMNMEDLESIQSKLKQKGIDLDYKKTAFNKNSKLSSISFKVDCNDEFSGSASQSFLTENSRFGFRRDYTEKVKTPFKIGSLGEF